MAQAKKDDNQIPTLLGVSNADGTTPVVLWADPTTHRLLVTYPFTIVNGETPNETPNGTITDFTIDNTPVSGSVVVFLNGVRQREGASNDYTISGLTITFNTAPLTDDVILVDYRH